MERAEHLSQRQTEPEKPWWAIPLGCDDETACRSLMPRRGIFGRKSEQVLWVSQGWLPIATFRYEFTYIAVNGGWGDRFRFGASSAAIEMVEGYAVGVPPSPSRMIQVPAVWMNLRPRYGVDELDQMIVRTQQSYLPAFPWDRQRDVGLQRFNVPPCVANLQVIATGTFLMPIFTAVIAAPSGNRVAVAEGITGKLDHHLSAHFTWHAPGLIDQLYDGRPVDW